MHHQQDHLIKRPPQAYTHLLSPIIVLCLGGREAIDKNKHSRQNLHADESLRVTSRQAFYRAGPLGLAC